MKYWLAMVNPQNLDKVKSHQCLGFRRGARRLLEEVQSGDVFFLYLTGVKEVCGPFWVAGNLFDDSAPLFKHGREPYTLRLPLTIGPLGSVPFMSVSQSLSWARSETNFSLPNLIAALTPGPMLLNDSDGTVLRRALVCS